MNNSTREQESDRGLTHHGRPITFPYLLNILYVITCGYHMHTVFTLSNLALTCGRESYLFMTDDDPAYRFSFGIPAGIFSLTPTENKPK